MTSDLQWGPVVGGWRLSISLDRTEFRPVDPIILTIVFENASTSPQEYGAQAKFFDYFLSCRDEQGKEVPLTLYGERMKGNRGHGRYVGGELNHGERLVNELSITRFLDLTLDGTYTLTVSRDVFPHRENKTPPVKSNSISFKIEEL
jgi:hypothetical protein